MTETGFEDRRRALEESFFHQQNEALAKKLRKEQKDREIKQVLAELTGVSDDNLLDDLVEAGVSAESIAAMSLYPLVAVAWADGKVEKQERVAVLRAAHEQGVVEGSAAHRLLEDWLSQKPTAKLAKTWREYVAALKKTLGKAALKKLEKSIIERAHGVAESAGGILGVGALSKEEKQALKDLKAAFA